MQRTLKIIGFFLGLLSISSAFAQSKQEKAYEKGKAAIQLMDAGKFDESIQLLEEAQKLDPNEINYPYEIAYAYYAQKEYKKASKQLESLTGHKNVKALIFQLLGNCYDNLGKSDKAIKTYEAGLKLFPNSGELYLELCVVQMMKKEYNKALTYCEKGIEVAPKHASNYYWAAKLYLSSAEEVWGMIYGELFMNLERNTKRTAEISELLYKTYKSEIKWTSDTSMGVSFSKNATIYVGANDLKNLEKMKLPFGVGIYEPMLMLSAMTEKKINLESLNKIRTKFVELYYKNEHDKKYPNILFDFQNKILKEGHFEAYNYWLLMKGDEDTFIAWQKEHTEAWDAFEKWFKEHKLKISDTNKFHRTQY
jgi:tetratricopeptide (TPR) repeat protein